MSTLIVVNTTRKQSTNNVTPIDPTVLAELASLQLNTCNSIKTLFATGYSQAQIVKAGYNPSTVYRQCAEYAKSAALAALQAQVA